MYICGEPNVPGPLYKKYKGPNIPNIRDQMFLGPFSFFLEEKERVALLLCQAKGEHSRLVPQDLCPLRSLNR